MFELISLGVILHEIHLGDLQTCLQTLRRRYPDAALVSINANGLLRENSRIEPLVEKLFETGFDLVTLGDQALARTGARRALDRWPRLIRPLNLPPDAPGRGAVELETAAGKVWFTSLFTGTLRFPVDDPFEVLEAFLKERAAGAPVVVDFFGADLGAKKALAWKLAERLPYVHILGTGLGVATDDLAIRDGRCGITDLGMVGGEDLIEGLPPQEWWNQHRRRVREAVSFPVTPLRVEGARLTFGPGFKAQQAERLRLRYPE